MNVKELKEACRKAIDRGFGEAEVMFDTEAARFNVHLVSIKNIEIVTKDITGNPYNLFILFDDHTNSEYTK